MGPYLLRQSLDFFERKVGPLARLSSPFCGLGEGSGGRTGNLRSLALLPERILYVLCGAKCLIDLFIIDEERVCRIEAKAGPWDCEGNPVKLTLLFSYPPRRSHGSHNRWPQGLRGEETPADKPRFEASWMFLPVFVMSGWYPVLGKKRRRSCPGSMP